jgi:hypothetical protein
MMKNEPFRIISNYSRTDITRHDPFITISHHTTIDGLGFARDVSVVTDRAPEAH